jgi:hypothetical protein
MAIGTVLERAADPGAIKNRTVAALLGRLLSTTSEGEEHK